MPVREYRDIDECRDEIQNRARDLRRSSDDDDDDKRDMSSAKSYIKDLRWFDEYLDETDIDNVVDFSVNDAKDLGFDLVDRFNGTTPQNRWKQIYNLYDRLCIVEEIEKNPLERWDGIKNNEMGINKTTAQEKHLDADEDYAPSFEEIALMEESVGVPRHRNQTLIRFLAQTGLRRGEAADLETEDIDRDSREVTVRAEVAKNNERRVVAWQPSLDGLMTEWLDTQRLMFANETGIPEEDRDNPWLWVNRSGGKMEGGGINEVVVKAAYNATDPETGEPLNRPLYADANAPLDEDGEPIPNRHKISAHNIRVALGSYLANSTDMGIYEISKSLGHKSVKVTEEKYVQHQDTAGLDPLKKFGPS